ncbi:hypothetical protein PG996_008232 [Apiospora saccharicola]|uniref:Uncharacterized protein n=1 Tax=Apiospora saccharicola TaxID=335842 RepID=A0ABR1UXG3_9PEZI
MVNATEIEHHMRGEPDGYTIPDDDGRLTPLFVFLGFFGFFYLVVASSITAIVYKELRDSYPVFRNDGCLVVLLPLVSFVAGVLFPVEILLYLVYICVAYLVRKTSEADTCCGFNFASYKARRAARRTQRSAEQRRQQQQQQQQSTQRPDQAEPIATPPPAYTARASPSDMEAGQA